MIANDYFELGRCKRAIDEYWHAHNVTEEIRQIDSEGIYWQKLH